MKIHWRVIPKELYWSIYAEFKSDLKVFGSCTDVNGKFGNPLILTEWGLKGSDIPFIKQEQRETFRHGGFDKITYYVAYVKKDPDEYVDD